MTGIDKNILKNLVAINSLPDQYLTDLAKKVTPEPVANGQFLFQRGDTDGLTVYVLRGEVELLSEKGVVKTVVGGSDPAKHPLAHFQPRQLAARARDGVVVVRIPNNQVDMMVTWNQSSGYVVEDISEGGAEDDWMSKMLQTKAFERIPPANIQSMFMKLEPVSYKAGDVVINQGDEGDFYYVIQTGRCAVMRKTKSSPEGVRLADLGPGDSFGEEALISDDRRNASVVMVTGGVLMRLSKKDFIQLLNQPMILEVNLDQAKKMADEGAVWMDVRLPTEFQNGHVAGAINVPFYVLRMKLGELDADKRYICYCDSGSRSSAVAYLLNERGYDAYVLKGGVVNSAPEMVTG